MRRALIVSAGTSANEYLSNRLGNLGYQRPVILPSGTEARRRMTSGEFELIVVNAPLPDEFGSDLCIDAVTHTDAGVILLAKAALADELRDNLSENGVMVIPKPFSEAVFLQSVRIAAASSKRLVPAREEIKKLQEKLAQLKLVNRAKVLLITQKNMTEEEAHRYIEKRAMDERRSRGDIAQAVLDELDTE